MVDLPIIAIPIVDLPQFFAHQFFAASASPFSSEAAQEDHRDGPDYHAHERKGAGSEPLPEMWTAKRKPEQEMTVGWLAISCTCFLQMVL